MNVNINFCLNYAANTLNENIFHSLTEKQQKIAVVAALIFSCVAAYCLVRHYCFKAKPLNQEDKNGDVKQPTKEVVEDHSKQTAGLEKAQHFEKELDDKQVAKKTAEKVDLVVKDEIQKADSPEKSLEVVEEKNDPKKSETIETEALEEPFDIDVENDELKIEKFIVQEKSLHDELPPLLSFGKVRKGVDGGDAPNLMGMQTCGRETIIDTDKLWSAAFASCFHTTESHQEILKFIREVRIQQDPLAKMRGPLEHYSDSYNKLYNNLVRLHHALPGKQEAKDMKIYWNDRAEKLLLPFFFKHENVDIEDLLFTIIPGEECQSSFQAPDIDFNFQFEFVGFEKKKLMEAMKKEIERLIQLILPEDDEGNQKFKALVSQKLEELKTEISGKNSLVTDAFVYIGWNATRLNFLEVERSIIEAEAAGLPKMSLEEKVEACLKKFHASAARYRSE